MAAGRLVPMVAAISPAAMRSLNDLPLVLGVMEIGLASASRVGWPCGLASFMAPSIQLHLREIDPAIVRQQPAHEDRGRHRIERNPDALAGEILRRADHAAIDRDIAVAEHARGKHRQRHERTVAGGEAGDVFGARHFRRIELQRARHPIENLARAVDGEEVEIDALGLHLLGIERQHAVVEAACEGDLDFGHSLGFPRGAGQEACGRTRLGRHPTRIFAIYPPTRNSRYKPHQEERAVARGEPDR